MVGADDVQIDDHVEPVAQAPLDGGVHEAPALLVAAAVLVPEVDLVHRQAHMVEADLGHAREVGLGDLVFALGALGSALGKPVGDVDALLDFEGRDGGRGGERRGGEVERQAGGGEGEETGQETHGG